MSEKEAELTALEATESADGSSSTAEASAGDAAGEDAPAAEVRADEPPVSRAEFDQLQTQYEQLRKERDGLVDRLARLQAEFENARKRAEKEKADFRDYATGQVVEQFLPVLDNFELALKSI